MNSFTLTAVGQLARNPETVAKGDVIYTRFCLIGNDYAGKDDEGIAREVVTSVWFVAFGAPGEIIARHSHKGDQLIVEARVRANNWTDKQGEKQFDLAFVVQGFKFGAPGKSKREELDGRREQTLSLPRGLNRGNGRERDRSYAVSGPGEEGGDRKPGDAADRDVTDRPETGPAEGPDQPTPDDHDVLEPESAESADPVATVPGDPAADPTAATDATVAADPNGTAVAVVAVGPVVTSGARVPSRAKPVHEKGRGSRSSRKAATAAV